MIIKRRQSNFSQFSEELWLTVEHDHTSIDVDVDQSELRQFTIMILDVAYDALSKMDVDTDGAQGQVADVMNRI